MHNTGGSSPMVTNCILWNNGPEEIFGPATVAYSDVHGGWPGIGNIDADPLFVDSVNGDHHLLPGSPCIDAGDNTAVPVDITTDLDGDGIVGIVDFLALLANWGTCERGCCLADLDIDGDVGITDFLILLGHWGP